MVYMYHLGIFVLSVPFIRCPFFVCGLLIHLGQLCFSVLYSFDHGLFASTISVNSGIISLIALDAHKHVWSRLIA